MTNHIILFLILKKLAYGGLMLPVKVKEQLYPKLNLTLTRVTIIQDMMKS